MSFFKVEAIVDGTTSSLKQILPAQYITPHIVFENVASTMLGPLYLKQGAIRKPTIVKSYVCVFVLISVKTVHLELVSNLTAESFIACLKRFVTRRRKSSSIWSDCGTNYIGATRILKELHDFLINQMTKEANCKVCSSQGIPWHFIPEKSPILVASGRLSLKDSPRTDSWRLQAWLWRNMYCPFTDRGNSRPLGIVPHNDDDGVECWPLDPSLSDVLSQLFLIIQNPTGSYLLYTDMKDLWDTSGTDGEKDYIVTL